MMIAGVLAIAATIPVAAFQTWRFVAPALTDHERRTALFYIPGLFIFYFGDCIRLFCTLSARSSVFDRPVRRPFSNDVYGGALFSLYDEPHTAIRVLFEMPLIVMFLTSLGILNPAKLSKMRKISYFALIVVSVVITPPDFISDVLVIVPLLVLYELSISLSAFIYRKNRRTTRG